MIVRPPPPAPAVGSVKSLIISITVIWAPPGKLLYAVDIPADLWFVFSNGHEYVSDEENKHLHVIFERN